MNPAKAVVRLQDIAEAAGAELIGSPEVMITGISGLDEAGPGDLAFMEGEHLFHSALATKASGLLVKRHWPEIDIPQLLVPYPRYAIARIAELFFVTPRKVLGVHPQACIGAEAELGAEVSIGPFVTIGERARIGARVTIYPGVFIGDDVTVEDDTVLYPKVSIMERCRIGRRVIIHAGTVIGADGFGFVLHEGRQQKIPQLGIVVVEDDVELGANVTVDRATYGQTVIKQGSKIDNLVQIAHNVRVGEHNILCAQSGIAGSTRLGSYVSAGGQAGINGHIEIGDGVTIWAKSGVNRSLAPRQQVSGAPAMPHEVSMKAHAVLPRLPALRERLRSLEQRLAALESVVSIEATHPAR